MSRMSLVRHSCCRRRLVFSPTLTIRHRVLCERVLESSWERTDGRMDECFSHFVRQRRRAIFAHYPNLISTNDLLFDQPRNEAIADFALFWSGSCMTFIPMKYRGDGKHLQQVSVAPFGTVLFDEAIVCSDSLAKV